MECVVQWATILSPIIAVLVAMWTIRSGAKDADRKVAATVDGIKRVMKLQAEITSLQLDMELWEQRFHIESNTIEMKDLYKEDAALENNSNRHKEKKELLLKQDFYLKQQDNLKGHIKRFEQIKKELELI